MQFEHRPLVCGENNLLNNQMARYQPVSGLSWQIGGINNKNERTWCTVVYTGCGP